MTSLSLAGRLEQVPSRIWRRAALHAPGLAMAVMLALAATFVGDHLGGPEMLYALLLGLTFNFALDQHGTGVSVVAGIEAAATIILRIGVALLGIRITFGEITSLGAPTILMVIGGVIFTLAVGTLIGRLFNLRIDHAVLSAGAVAICGASAALAIAAVLPVHKHSERNTILTVVGVTGFSTLAMVCYPMIAQLLGLSDIDAGIFLGATIHDVAQVVAAGHMISDEAAQTAAITKLMRVACLAPAVLIIGLYFRGSAVPAGKRPPLLPLFLVAFLALVLINSFGLVHPPLASIMADGSRWCLTIAVAALGVKTSLRDFIAVGLRPIAVLTLQTLVLAGFILTIILLLF